MLTNNVLVPAIPTQKENLVVFPYFNDDLDQVVREYQNQTIGTRTGAYLYIYIN